MLLSPPLKMLDLQPVVKGEFQFWEKDRLVCRLCPHDCALQEGDEGLCGGRRMIDGQIIATNYGQICSLLLDPIEKKPLYHYFPGCEILSVGPNGCNLKCKWCQNHHFSQAVTPTRLILPQALADMVDAVDGLGVAYTYSEPLVWFEYARDAGRILHERGLRNVFISNGFVNEAPLRELLPFTDAFSIDLKSKEEYCYRHFCGGRLEDVERTIKIVYESRKHLEITHLLVTGVSTDLNKLELLVKWVAEIDRAIPLHLIRYFPANKYDEPPTDLQFMSEAYKTARTYLDYVYLGNLWSGEGQSSYCPHCGELLIRRSPNHVEIVGLDGNLCSRCGASLNFVIQ